MGKAAIDEVVWPFEDDDQESEPEYLEPLHTALVPFDEEELGPPPDDARELVPVAAPLERPELVEIYATSFGIIDAISRHHEQQLGLGALAELRGRLEKRMEWAVETYNKAIGPFEPFAHARAKDCVQEFFRDFHRKRLRIERRDQDEREAAIRDGESGIAEFLQRHDKRMKRLQWLYRRRWHVPEHSDEDVRGEIMVETLASFRLPQGFTRHVRPGKAATFSLASHVVKKLKLRKLIAVVVTPDLFKVPSLDPTPEDLMIDVQRERALADLAWKGRAKLSRIRRRWMDEIQSDIELHDKLKLSRVARRMERGKGTATEARDSLRDDFEVMGYRDLIER